MKEQIQKYWAKLSHLFSLRGFIASFVFFVLIRFLGTYCAGWDLSAAAAGRINRCGIVSTPIEFLYASLGQLQYYFELLFVKIGILSSGTSFSGKLTFGVVFSYLVLAVISSLLVRLFDRRDELLKKSRALTILVLLCVVIPAASADYAEVTIDVNSTIDLDVVFAPVGANSSNFDKNLYDEIIDDQTEILNTLYPLGEGSVNDARSYNYNDVLLVLGGSNQSERDLNRAVHAASSPILSASALLTA